MNRSFWKNRCSRFTGGVLILLAVVLLSTACEKPTVNIGLIATLSGRKADLGIQARNGARLAVDMINAEGGVDGRMLKLIAYDDGDSRQTAIEAFRALEAEDPDVIIGPVTSVMADALYDLILESGIPVVSPSVTSSHYQDKKDNFYHLMPPNSEQGKMLGEYLVSRGYNESLGVYDLSNRSYAEGVIDDTAAFLTEHTGEDSYSIKKIGYNSKENPSFRQIAVEMAGESPDAVVLACNGLDASYFVQSLDLEGYTGPVIGSTWAMSIDAIPLLGKLSDRMRFIGLTKPDDVSERYKTFIKNYYGIFQIHPLHIAVYSYDSVQLIRTAVESGRELGSDSSKVFTGLEVTSGCQVDFTIDENGDSNRELYVLKIEGQKFTVDE